MTVALLHPAWDRSCTTCETILFREDGTPVLDRRTSLPLLRPPTIPTPCHHCPKVPHAVRAAGGDPREMRRHAADLTPQDRKAWAFFRKCRAVGRFPDDPLVEWTAGVLQSVYDRVAHAPLQQLTARIDEMLKHVQKRG